MRTSIKLRNALHPGYSACSRCGGNWGWKKEVTHMVGESRGIFLFCEQCDKVVSLKERWNALDEWKINCLSGMTLEEVQRILDTEFIEFPRK